MGEATAVLRTAKLFANQGYSSSSSPLELSRLAVVPGFSFENHIYRDVVRSLCLGSVRLNLPQFAESVSYSIITDHYGDRSRARTNDSVAPGHAGVVGSFQVQGTERKYLQTEVEVYKKSIIF